MVGADIMRLKSSQKSASQMLIKMLMLGGETTQNKDTTVT